MKTSQDCQDVRLRSGSPYIQLRLSAPSRPYQPYVHMFPYVTHMQCVCLPPHGLYCLLLSLSPSPPPPTRLPPESRLWWRNSPGRPATSSAAVPAAGNLRRGETRLPGSEEAPLQALPVESAAQQREWASSSRKCRNSRLENAALPLAHLLVGGTPFVLHPAFNRRQYREIAPI